jgi:hypothetical protein
MSSQRRRKFQLLAAALIVLLAGIVRLAGTRGDLYVDEIWSWNYMNQANGLSGILAKKHDNNHILNTIIMYLIGPAAKDAAYRWPAAAASSATVGLAGFIAWRRGGFESAVSALLLVGSSYLLTLYGSEARGYAYAVFFALLSWILLQRTVERTRVLDGVLFAICASLGFLSHLTFVYCYAGFCVWTINLCVRKPLPVLLLAHIPPLTTAALLYLFFVRGMTIGGGRSSNLVDGVISTLSLTAGGPVAGRAAVVAGLGVGLCFFNGIIHLWRTDRARAACYVTIVVGAPALVLLSTRHELVYPRYFLIPVCFGLLVIGEELTRWGRSGPRGRLARVVVVLLCVTLNGRWIVRLLNGGRGQYVAALTWMVERTSGDQVVIAGDHDFRNGSIVDFYAPRLWPRGPTIIYTRKDRLSPEGTQWWLAHNFEATRAPPASIRDRFDNAYQLEKMFPHRSLSGYNWWVYRRVAP